MTHFMECVGTSFLEVPFMILHWVWTKKNNKKWATKNEASKIKRTKTCKKATPTATPATTSKFFSSHSSPAWTQPFSFITLVKSPVFRVKKDKILNNINLKYGHCHSYSCHGNKITFYPFFACSETAFVKDDVAIISRLINFNPKCSNLKRKEKDIISLK